MIQDFFIKKMIKAKAPGVTDEQIDQIVTLVKKNPALFQTIAKEIETKTKAGMAQEQAMMQVMQAHKDELKGLMQ